MPPHSRLSTAFALLLALPLTAADWPMDRYDAGRTSASPQELAATLHLQWSLELPPLRPAWPDQPAMQFDVAYNPIVLGKTLFFGSSRNDSVTALDVETGVQKWIYTTDGPVRFAPVGWDGKVYFVSDDGHLYCVAADSGTLLWKFRGGPSDRRILGNERLISTWPARGAPVIADGTVYFAASIWPFMGVFIHALDAKTGKVIWTNDGDGSTYMKQPHHADSFAGVAPQGALVVVGDKLLVPGGRSVPACLDRATGKLLHYRLADNSKIGGGSDVAALDDLFFNGGEVFDLATGDHLGDGGEHVVLTPDVLYTCSKRESRAFDWPGEKTTSTHLDRKGHQQHRDSLTMHRKAQVAVTSARSTIKAGSRLYVGATNRVFSFDLPLEDGERISWEAAIEGEAVNLVAAADRLFVVTREGRLYCFGAAAKKLNTAKPTTPVIRKDEWTEKARRILETTQVRDGYCVAWGVGSGRLIVELARQSNLHVIAVEPNADKVAAIRKRLLADGLYGERLVVYHGTPQSFALPPYLAGLMVSEEAHILDAAFLDRVTAALRPYGGVACFPGKKVKHPTLTTRPGPLSGWVTLAREGAIPGAADWTHEHADAANTRVSKDRVVRAPLGVLWWGGPSHDGILPRHGHGPQPQVVEGRVLIEGVDMLRALDLYTGRLLWQTELPGVGKAFDNTSHQPGANSSGGNFVSTPQGIYVAHGHHCVRLDLVTGKVLAEFKLPTTSGESTPPVCGHLKVSGAFLIAGANVLDTPKAQREALSSSKYLFVLDRATGKVLWQTTARSGYRHNAVCVGGNRLFVIDRPSADHLAKLRRRGESNSIPPRLTAFDLATGKEVWSSEEHVFGTWLSYSAKHDVLIEAGLQARDTLSDEADGMRAWRADQGKELWHQRDYSGPGMIHGDMVFRDRGTCDILTGAVKMRRDPLTGESTEWSWARGYGCNTPAASEHLLTFRSGAAGFFDLANDGGTGNFGGFRSSCTNNLIVAGGVLVAPDYTRTCTCSYQNQTSLALVPMSDAEMWTFQGSRIVTGAIERVGINLGAPGDRKATDGTLWLEYPQVGGPSPSVTVRHQPEDVKWFRHHAARIQSGRLPWVAASGAKGLHSLTVELDRQGAKERRFTVRLHFVEPDPVQPGQRLLDIELQGKRVLEGLDIVKAAGGAERELVREFRGIAATDELTVTLHPSARATLRETVLCGIEIIAE